LFNAEYTPYPASDPSSSDKKSQIKQITIEMLPLLPETLFYTFILKHKMTLSAICRKVNRLTSSPDGENVHPLALFGPKMGIFNALLWLRQSDIISQRENNIYGPQSYRQAQNINQDVGWNDQEKSSLNGNNIEPVEFEFLDQNSPISKFVITPLLEFDVRYAYFLRCLKIAHKRRPKDKHNVHVRRDHIFEDTYHQWQRASTADLRRSLNITFIGEDGIDAGGLTKEFFLVLSRTMFNPSFGLFISNTANGGDNNVDETGDGSDNNNLHMPSPFSFWVHDHLSWFRFIGRFVGKAIFEGERLDCYFIHALYKHLLGYDITLEDLKVIDGRLYKSMLWILHSQNTYQVTKKHNEWKRKKEEEMMSNYVDPFGSSDDDDNGDDNGDESNIDMSSLMCNSIQSNTMESNSNADIIEFKTALTTQLEQKNSPQHSPQHSAQIETTQPQTVSTYDPYAFLSKDALQSDSDDDNQHHFDGQYQEDEIKTLGFTFSVETSEYGQTRARDLIPFGTRFAVNVNNCNDFIYHMTKHITTGQISEQLVHFVDGFHELIPRELISIFTPQEFELILCGLPTIDAKELQSSTHYQGFGTNPTTHPLILMFWKCIDEYFTNDLLSSLLLFVMGTSKVPINGFGSLQYPFSIQLMEKETDTLPRAHTCFNQLDLPIYTSIEVMRDKLITALKEGALGFGAV
jgi:hypothetical protein